MDIAFTLIFSSEMGLYTSLKYSELNSKVKCIGKFN